MREFTYREETQADGKVKHTVQVLGGGRWGCHSEGREDLERSREACLDAARKALSRG